MNRRSPPPLPLNLDARPLSDLAPRMPFWKGMRLGNQGEPCNSLYIIAEGQVLLCRHGADGKNRAILLLGPGDLFGEGSLRRGRWLVTPTGATNGAAHVLPASLLPRLAQYYPQLTAHIVALMSGRLEHGHLRTDLMRTHSARDRILALLRMMGDRHGQPEGDQVWLALPVTQAALGEMVGLARETVVRALAELEQEGAIRREGRRGLWLCETEEPF